MVGRDTETIHNISHLQPFIHNDYLKRVEFIKGPTGKYLNKAININHACLFNINLQQSQWTTPYTFTADEIISESHSEGDL